MTTGQLRVLAVATLLVATVAAAPAQNADCPEQSNAPQCRPDAEPEPAPAEEPTRTTPTQRPTTPPGQASEPTTGGGTTPGRTDDPQPDRGSDDTTNGGTTVGSTGASTGGSSSGATGRGTSGSNGSADPGTASGDLTPADAQTGAPIPPPPPDLGARRMLETRLVPGPLGPEIAIAVVEARARGVDGGWTVTVEGGTGEDVAVAARPQQPAGPVGLIIGRNGGQVPGFTVVGQRSTTVYDADYHGLLQVGAGAPAVITVTLFQ